MKTGLRLEACRWVALLVLGGIQALWFVQPLPPVLLVGHLALLVVAVMRPAAALVVLAAVGPLTTSIAEITGSQVAGARHLEAMMWTVIAGAVFRWRSGVPTRTGRPALVFGAVCLASAVAVYPARFLQMLSDQPALQAVVGLGRDYFVRSPFGDPLFFAMLGAGGAALVWVTEYLTRRTAGVTTWVVIAALVSHAVVALHNLQRLVEAASRRDDSFGSLWEMWLTVRVSSQYDVNAAASVFAMVAVASVGAWTLRKSYWQVPATGLVLAGVWLTGSRVAIVAVAVASLVAFVVGALGAGKRGRWQALAGVTVMIALAAIVVAVYPSKRNLNLPASVESRAVLFKSGVAMVKDSPVFGIGVGRFLELSERYGSADIARILQVERTHDNAHNNFLQVAAELGVVGFLAFVWLLGACVAGGVWRWRQLAVQERWLLAGVAGMMLTWLTGHPLLVPEAAVMFWLFAGMVATVGASPSPASNLERGATTIALAAIIVSVPWQAAAQRDRADLEHLARGLSVWHVTDSGERFRDAGRGFSLFLPSAHLITLPLRAAPGAPSPLTVTVRVAGKVVDVVVVEPDDWLRYVFRVPDSPAQFVDVTFTVESPGGVSCDACLQVGKQVARPAPGV